MVANGAGMMVPLTPEVVEAALTAVSYEANYARTVSTRLCLHYINSIRRRVTDSGVTWLIISVDGCESSLVEPTGRCDIYYCRPYKFELQLAQKTPASSDFIVRSIYRTVDQKTVDEIREEESNLDFDMTAGVDVPWQVAGQKKLQLPIDEDDEEENEPWADDVECGSQSAAMEAIAASLRSESVTLSVTEPEQTAAIASGSTAIVAVAGIAIVSASIIVFVLALIKVRWRSRVNATKTRVNRDDSSFRTTANTTPNVSENMVSTASMDDIDVPDNFGFFI